MKFIIHKGSPLFENLSLVWNKCLAANAEADKLAAEIGADGVAKSNSSYIGGGIDAFYFKSGKGPEGFRKVDKYSYDFWYPKSSDKRNKELFEKMGKLPRVSYTELQEPLNYHNQSFSSGGGLSFSTLPSLIFQATYILVDVNDNATYTPVDGMQEILSSEFKKLKDEKK